mgnify:CR=1 FL=1
MAVQSTDTAYQSEKQPETRQSLSKPKHFQFELRKSDMPSDMQQAAISQFESAFHTATAFNPESIALKPLAEKMKRTMDAEFGPHWHCIIGRSFGSFVTHEPGRFLFGYVNDEWAVLLFRTI